MWCSNLTPLATVNRVFLLLVIAMAECNTCGPGLITPGVTIPKGDIMIESGEPLEIFCVLNKSIDIAANRSARDLIFLRDNKVVPSEFLEIINETTVRLYVKQPPPSESMYYCKLQTPADEIKPGQSRDTAVCLNKVFVGTKPQEVKNFTCISQNWQNLTCSWEKPENFVKTKYKLRYRFPGRAGGRMQYGCPSNTDETSNYCFWNDSTDPHYRLPYAYYYYNLTGENQFGNTSFSHKFHHYGHVIPAPPTDLIVSGTTHNSVLLNWSIPYAMHTFPPGLIQRVVYQAEYDTNDIWLPANTSNLKIHGENHSLNITGLKYAHMLYEVRISMKSAVATGEDKWSTPTNITFMTSAIVPGAPPKTDIGSFEVSGGLLRDVYIYWRYIPNEMKNGDKFEYKILSVEENGQKRNLHPNETTKAFAKFKGISNNSYRFVIVSANSVGNSKESSVVYVPSRHESPPEPLSFTKIAYGDGVFELSWKQPDFITEIDSYTIFWCENDRDRPYQCKGLLDWTHVSKNITIHNVTVPDDRIYQFAISANAKKSSSGMVWAACTVIHNKGISKMKSVWINRIGATHLQVGWKLDCSERIGTLKGYRIYYCPIVSPYNLTCKEAEKNRTIFDDRQTANSYTVDGLKPYTTYMVSIAVITKAGEGAHSDPLYNTTLESAPDPVMDVSVCEVSNTSMIVSWSPPTNMNGHFRYYTVHYNNRTSQNHFKIEKETQTMGQTTLGEWKVAMKNLSPFETYYVSVTACTVACSEINKTVSVTTLVGVPGEIDTPIIQRINSSLVSVHWKPPRNPGGIINYYEILVQQSDNKNNLSSIYYTSYEHRTQVPILNCATDGWGLKYTFSIRAVNKDENGNKFRGPWSQEGKEICYSTGPAQSTIIVIWIFGTLALIILAVALYYIGRWSWNRFEKMRVVEIILPEGLKSISEKEKDHSFNSLHWTMEDSDGSERSIPTKPSNTSADEELLLQRKEERHGRNPSGDSSGCTSGHASVSSSLTSGTQMSSDSGTEVDQRPPSPDGVFEESSGWEASSLRQRNVSSLRGDPYLKMGKNSANGSGSVARSTPNLTDLEAVGVNASGQGCCGLGTGSSSTGYISMPSSEEMGSGAIPANITDDGYCCLALDESSRPLEDVKSPLQQSHASKGYVSLSNVMKTISSPIFSPQHHQPVHTIQPVSPIHTPQPTGYVTNVPSRPSSQELSPTKEYVMSGDISDLGSDRRNSPSKFLFEEDEDRLNINFELDNDADSYSSYELRGTESLDDLTNLEDETLGTEKELPKSNVGYVTFTEPTSNINLISKSSGITGGSSGYIPHKQFNKEDILSSTQTTTSNKDLKESNTKVFPPTGRIPKSPTNV